MGLALRERNGTDRRLVYVRITDDGTALIRQAFPPHADTVTRLMAVLTVDEQNTLENLLRRLGTQQRES